MASDARSSIESVLNALQGGTVHPMLVDVLDAAIREIAREEIDKAIHPNLAPGDGVLVDVFDLPDIAAAIKDVVATPPDGGDADGE